MTLNPHREGRFICISPLLCVSLSMGALVLYSDWVVVVHFFFLLLSVKVVRFNAHSQRDHLSVNEPSVNEPPLSVRVQCHSQYVPKTYFTPPPLSGGIGSRQQKQRLRAPRRRSRPPSRGGCRRSGRLGRPRPSASPRRSRRGAPSRG